MNVKYCDPNIGKLLNFAKFSKCTVQTVLELQKCSKSSYYILGPECNKSNTENISGLVIILFPIISSHDASSDI